MQASDITVRTAAATAIGVLYQTCGLTIISDSPLVNNAQEADVGHNGGESTSEASLDSQEAFDTATAAHVDVSACSVGLEARDVLQRGLHDILKQLGDLVAHRCASEPYVLLVAFWFCW
jgi:hypothetical protein